nr:MAG: hypothetical protein AmFV_00167 [Apis mellifera filamentous virus]WOK43282.1 MAG: hypothetical protein [Apis mellifera filamentous virus]
MLRSPRICGTKYSYAASTESAEQFGPVGLFGRLNPIKLHKLVEIVELVGLVGRLVGLVGGLIGRDGRDGLVDRSAIKNMSGAIIRLIKRISIGSQSTTYKFLHFPYTFR